jgi:hypothetical protein
VVEALGDSAETETRGEVVSVVEGVVVIADSCGKLGRSPGKAAAPQNIFLAPPVIAGLFNKETRGTAIGALINFLVVSDIPLLEILCVKTVFTGAAFAGLVVASFVGERSDLGPLTASGTNLGASLRGNGEKLKFGKLLFPPKATKEADTAEATPKPSGFLGLGLAGVLVVGVGCVSCLVV